MKNHRVWLVGSIVIITCLSIFTFFSVLNLKRVPQNAESIMLNCQERNRQLKQINLKFAQLNSLIELSIAQNALKGEVVSKQFLEAFEKFRTPVTQTDCESLVK